ncbi:MAG: cell division transport system permease protein [Parcubacteria group bacterium Gr01-1014_66]|nr:MAG: cell division transport system permease protein [Parcubacteria group bacterium Gr01-1014_66]
MITTGWLGFVRNGWLSVATITVMTLTLFVLGGLVLGNALAQSAINSLASQIDITVHFVPEAGEEEIFAVKREIETIPDVQFVDYVSREGALAAFRQRHQNDAFIAEALAEIGENPLEASLNIRAVDPSRYPQINAFLAKKQYPRVDRVNYEENQGAIDRLSSVIGSVRSVGVIIAIILGGIAVLIAFNTIRLTIYTMREEIGIMRLVGATRRFIRGPFLVNGILYGVFAACATTALFLPLVWLGAPRIALIAPDFNLFQYFTMHVLEFLILMIAAGVLLGTISSIIAIRRYLDV